MRRSAEPFILRLAEATSLHLRWSADDAPEWVPIPGRVIVPLGTSGSGLVSLVLDGVARPSAVHMLTDVLRLLCERDRCSAESERIRRSELLAEVADRSSLETLIDRRADDCARTVVLLSLDAGSGSADREPALGRFAEVIAEQVRPTDTIVRSGHTELFLVLATEAVRATHIVDRIRTAWRADTPALTFSAGVAAEDGRSHDDPLAMAQTALQRAHIEGGDRSVLACPPAVQNVV